MRQNKRVTRSLSQTCLLTGGSGSLVQVFEEKRDGIKIGETAEVTLGYCKVIVWESYRASHGFNPNKPEGRIFVSQDEGFVRLAKGGKVSATMPSLEGGSENSRNNGYPVQYVWLETKSGEKLHWCDMPGIISSQFSVQVGQNYKLPENCTVGDLLWGSVPIMKITDLRTPKANEAAAPTEAFA